VDGALIVLAAVLIAGAAVSVTRSIAFRHRLPAERRAYAAWLARARGRFGPEVAQPAGGADVLCAATLRGRPRYRQCLLVSRGATVVGGFRLPLGTGLRGARRSACFGVARRETACRSSR
jgi:hypothetical protein